MMSDVAAALSIPQPDLLRLWSGTVHQRDSGDFPTIELNLEHICRESGIQADAGQIARAVGLRLEYMRNALTPRDDTLETLAGLKASGYKIGLVSDYSVEVSNLWPAGPLASLFDVAILSCEVRITKPDPRVYEMVCQGLQVSPNRCLYVGDGGSGELTGASEFGMEVVLIHAPYDTVSGSREDWPGTRIAAINEVLALVNRPS